MTEKKHGIPFLKGSTPFDKIREACGGDQCEFCGYTGKTKLWHCRKECNWEGTEPCLIKDTWICPIATREMRWLHVRNWHKRRILK